MTRGRVRAIPRSASHNLRGIRVSVCRYPGTPDQSFSSPESGGTVPGLSGMSMGRGEFARSWSSTAALICCSSGAAVALSVRAPAPAALWRSSLCSVVFPLPTPPLMKTRRPAPAALASKLFHKKGDALSGSRSRLRPSKGLMYTYPRTCIERRATFLIPRDLHHARYRTRPTGTVVFQPRVDSEEVREAPGKEGDAPSDRRHQGVFPRLCTVPEKDVLVYTEGGARSGVRGRDGAVRGPSLPCPAAPGPRPPPR